MHARNVAILIGADMREPVNAMVCWTENGRVQGGTGMAIRLAQHYRIPILNLATLDVREAMDRLDGIAETRSRRDVGEERALADPLPARRLSEMAARPAPEAFSTGWTGPGSGCSRRRAAEDRGTRAGWKVSGTRSGPRPGHTVARRLWI